MFRVVSAILFILINFVYVSALQAEALKLKNGFFMKGVVLGIEDETIHFKSSFGKQISYAFSDVDTVDGLAVTDFEQTFKNSKNKISKENTDIIITGSLSKNGQESDKTITTSSARFLKLSDSDQDLPNFRSRIDDDWDHWLRGISSYHARIERIVRDANDDFETLRAQGVEATSEEKVLRFIEIFRKRIGSKIKKIQGIQPPAELSSYHEYILEHLRFLDSSQEQLALMNFNQASQDLMASQSAYSQAMSILRNVFSQQGAPKTVISELDFAISNYQISEGLN